METKINFQKRALKLANEMAEAESQMVDAGQIPMEAVINRCKISFLIIPKKFLCQEYHKKYYYVCIIGSIFALTYLANIWNT